GLPLMGTGDWNDGMNRVGAEGRGESVWLGWFLCQLVEDFAPIAIARGEPARAAAWREAALGWRNALLGTAWDGQWFKRAFFDDGTPLGSHVNAECRVDLIAQAWSVMSDVAPPAMRRMALAAIEDELVDPDMGLLRLLTPPLQDALPSAGYIQAYPKGVRENGGQYSHAGVWALIAQAMSGDGDAAYRYFTYLNPAHRAAHPVRGPAYEIEPYVMAGDVYSEAPHAGRGGWSWYTGSAAWLHRAAIEHIFGMRLRADEIAFVPCLPSHWDHAELTLTRADRVLRVLLCRPEATAALELAQRIGASEQQIGVAWRHDAHDAPACVLLRLPEAAVVDATRSRPTAPGVAVRWAADEAVHKVHSSTTP
ncbi:MAG: glycosyl hydrolase family 65 protein, partial [Burkholderiales bacterium]